MENAQASWKSIALANPREAAKVFPSGEDAQGLLTATYLKSRTQVDVALAGLAGSIRLAYEVVVGDVDWRKITGPKTSKATAIEFLRDDTERKISALEIAIMEDGKSNILAQREIAAEKAYADYEFDCPIAGTGGWDDTHSDDWTKIVFAELSGSDDSDRVNFHVTFAPESAEVVDVTALDLKTGNVIGQMPAPEVIYNVTVIARKYSPMQEGDAEPDVEYDTRNENEDMSSDEIAQLVRDLGIYETHITVAEAGVSAHYDSVTPDGNREHFEQGIDTYYEMHLNSVDGEPVALDSAKAFASEFGIQPDRNFEPRSSAMRMG
jgi:hypothetical protein